MAEGAQSEWLASVLQALSAPGIPPPTRYVTNPSNPSHIRAVINARLRQADIHDQLIGGSVSALLPIALTLRLDISDQASTSSAPPVTPTEEDGDTSGSEEPTDEDDAFGDVEEHASDDDMEPVMVKGNVERNKERQKLQRSCRGTTVKCMLKSRLDNPEKVLPIINQLVGYVSACARAGSERFNAWLLGHLATETEDKPFGTLPDYVNLDSKVFLERTIVACFRKPTETLDSSIAQSHNVVHIQRHPGKLSGTDQAVKYAARQYVTMFKNMVDTTFYQRFHTFCRAICQRRGLFGRTLNVASSSMLRVVLASEEIPPLDLVAAMPGALRIIAQLRGILAPVRASPYGYNSRTEALYMLCVLSERVGFASWSVAPLHSLERMHVSVDAEVWQRFFAPRLKKEDVYGSDFKHMTLSREECSEHLMAMFNANLRKLRSEQCGWIPCSSFKTDGYSLCVTFFNPQLERPKKPKKRARKTKQKQRVVAKAKSTPTPKKPADPYDRSTPAGAQVLGADPGDVVAVTFAGITKGGKYWWAGLRTKELQIKSGEKGVLEQMKRRCRRVQHCFDALGWPGAFRTSSLEKQAQYLMASSAHAQELASVLGSPHVKRCKMAVYGKKARVIDCFLHRLPIDKRRPVVVAYGAGKWSPTATASRPPAPGHLVFKRTKLWASAVKMVHEKYTTKMSFFSRSEGWDVKGDDGKVLRGLKRDESHVVLSAHTAGLLPQRVPVVDAGGRIGVHLSRDGNAALNIRECVARCPRLGDGRPRYLR